jgi:hypothetical protein
MTNSLAFTAAGGPHPAAAARVPHHDPHVDRPLARVARRDPRVDGSPARVARRHGGVGRPTRVTLDGALTAILMIAVAFIGAALVDVCALTSMAG